MRQTLEDITLVAGIFAFLAFFWALWTMTP
jgi:hypothetical protein